ncbi:unnamed protein product, partial [Chrysoparadoxa australica]
AEGTFSSATAEDSRLRSVRLDWAKGRMIGSGQFGDVYIGMRLDTGELLAVKQFPHCPGTGYARA